MIRFTRRDFTALAVSTFVRPTLATADPSPIVRAIPKTGERLPAVGLGTASVFEPCSDARNRISCRLTIRSTTAKQKSASYRWPPSSKPAS